jgi:hypothetical protein
MILCPKCHHAAGDHNQIGCVKQSDYVKGADGFWRLKMCDCDLSLDEVQFNLQKQSDEV